MSATALRAPVNLGWRRTANCSQALGQLRHRGARQPTWAAAIGEGALDVTHQEPASIHLDRRAVDADPTVEEEGVAVSHKDSVEDMVRKGRDLEKIVLARAVYAHLQHQVLVYDNRTVVFD